MKSKYKIGQKVWFIANQFSVVEGTVKMTYTIGGGTKYLIACQNGDQYSAIPEDEVSTRTERLERIARKRVEQKYRKAFDQYYELTEALNSLPKRPDQKVYPIDWPLKIGEYAIQTEEHRRIMNDDWRGIAKRVENVNFKMKLVKLKGFGWINIGWVTKKEPVKR